MGVDWQLSEILMALTPLNEASSDPDVEILICSLQNHYIDSEPIPWFASSLKIDSFPYIFCVDI